MAFALIRLHRLPNSLSYRRLLSGIYRQERFISTSEKKRETAICPTDESTAQAEIVRNASKNWITYGFDKVDKDVDRMAMHLLMFFSVTLCLVFGGFFMAYAPDVNNRDWTQREAFLELRRREALGLPQIDPNLVDPTKLYLPSDEELGKTEIYI